jgi:hypothetical protein
MKITEHDTYDGNNDTRATFAYDDIVARRANEEDLWNAMRKRAEQSVAGIKETRETTLKFLQNLKTISVFRNILE